MVRLRAGAFTAIAPHSIPNKNKTVKKNGEIGNLVNRLAVLGVVYDDLVFF